MGKPLFDFSDGELAFTLSNNIAMDFKGNMMMRLGDNMAMDLKSGKLHFTSPWEPSDEDDE